MMMMMFEKSSEENNRLNEEIEEKLMLPIHPPIMVANHLNNNNNFGLELKNDKDQETRKGRKLYQYLATVVAGSAMAQSGMNLGWTSPMVPYLKSSQSFLPGLTETEESWVTSLMALGAILGAVPTGKLADAIGRKYSIAITATPFLICWLTLIFTSDLTLIYVARFVGGIGAGAACVIVPVYIGEIAEPAIRGALTTFFPISFSSGIFFAYTAGAFLDYYSFNILCCTTLVPFLLGVFFLPETPTWLIHQGRKAEACKVLKTLRGPNCDISSEVTALLEEMEQLESKRGGFRDLVTTLEGRKALVAAVGLMWFQQMCGIDAILFYTVDIFKDAKSTIDPYYATMVIGFVEVAMGVVVAVTIDKCGRKPLLVFSGICMTICLGILGYYFHMQAQGQDVTSMGWLPLFCLGTFNVVYSLGYGSVPYSMISELFPPETKGIASSISIMTNWSLVFLVTKIFPTLEHYMGQAWTFWMFAAISAASAVFALFVPETKGKTLQEIQTKLSRRKENRKVVEALTVKTYS